jgi:hypothetical protein
MRPVLQPVEALGLMAAQASHASFGATHLSLSATCDTDNPSLITANTA